MRKANILTVIVFLLFIFGLTLADVINESKELSIAERRKLASFPKTSLDTILAGQFTKDYGSYLQDQVVLRDELRSLKSFVELELLHKRENNGVYIVDDSIYDKFYGINQRYIVRAAELINALVELIPSDKILLSVIPSKAHMLNSDEYLLSDQNSIAEYLETHTRTTYIDLMSLVEESDQVLYYRTDHHWTTPGAIQAYKVLISSMGYSPIEDYSFEVLTDTFVGSNYGKAAINSIEKDTIVLAHNQLLDNMSVCRYETLEQAQCFESIYFRDNTTGLDPYDVFIGGAGPIIVLENTLSWSDEELILFKDSYSHALSPFLAQHYRKVTLFDLRYVRKELIFENFDLEDKTVLFLFSTTILNTDPQILN